jgi:hypothetical protein
MRSFRFRKFIIPASVILLLAVFFTLRASVMTEAGENADGKAVVSMYTGVKLREGDTLESLAAKYNSGCFESNDEYIRDIRRINNMTTEKLHPGCYLTVKYYAGR